MIEGIDFDAPLTEADLDCLTEDSLYVGFWDALCAFWRRRTERFCEDSPLWRYTEP